MATSPAVSVVVSISADCRMQYCDKMHQQLERRDVVHVTHRYTAQRTWLRYFALLADYMRWASMPGTFFVPKCPVRWLADRPICIIDRRKAGDAFGMHRREFAILDRRRSSHHHQLTFRTLKTNKRLTDTSKVKVGGVCVFSLNSVSVLAVAICEQ